MTKVSATKRILTHLKQGHSITPLQALERYGIFRLADVIFKLRWRDGHNIKTEIVEGPRADVIDAESYNYADA